MKTIDKQKMVDAIVKKIEEQCGPMIDAYVSAMTLDEASSTMYYDAAERAEKYGQTDLAARFRSMGDEALEREQHTEHEVTLDVLKEIELPGGRVFTIAKYIPHNMNVLVFQYQKNYTAVVRLRQNDITEIKSMDIKTDIANLYQRRAIAKSNLYAIGCALNRNKAVAKDVASQINELLGTNIHYRYFMGDKAPARQRYVTEGEYLPIDETPASGYEVCIVQRKKNLEKPEDPDTPFYNIYYILIGNAEKSFMFRLYVAVNENLIYGCKAPQMAYRVMKKQGWLDGGIDGKIAQPTPKSSDITNVYDFFKNEETRRTGKLILNWISSVLKIKLSIDAIEKGFLKENPEEVEDSRINKAPQPEDADMSDFLDM